jgi:replicative DNA helicase
MRQDKNKSVMIIPEGGKIPPQSPETEEAVLGAIMLEEDAAIQIISILKPEMFYVPAHQHIYTAIYDMVISGKVVDIITLMSELRKRNTLEEVGGPVYLTELISKVVSAANVLSHAFIVKQKYAAREYIRLSIQIQSLAYEDSDITEIAELAENEILKISMQTENKEPKRIDSCVDELLTNVKKVIDNPGQLIGLPSGMIKIDRITGGWQKSDLIIIAARPSMGKSAIASIFAKNAALYNYPVAFFSLEMSNEQLTGRWLSGVSGYSNMEIRNGNLNFSKLVEASEQIAALPIYVDDTPAISIAELRSKTKKLIIKNGIKMIIIDYLQLIKGEGNSREQEVASVSRGLKAIAKEFNIPVIVLAQLNREVEAKADKRPGLAMLRESGQIEQDADIVAFIYRPAYYGITNININGEELITKGLMMFDIQKNRSGALYPVPLYHNESLTVISDNHEDINVTPF